MPRLPYSFHGRKVKWTEIGPNHDRSNVMQHSAEGVIMDTHWDNNTCYALVVEKSGRITSHEMTDLVIINPPAIVSP